MKILKIEGGNLACFSTFAVDLDKGPLAEASLFAITGRTGAGKSTLLDAVCLALYGKLPRVERHAGSDLGGGYHTGKAASIIRRGQSGGYAACEFSDNDGVRYRSEWRVKAGQRGARKAVLGDPVLSLSRDGKPMPEVRTKSEHQAEIERLVGLGEVEFRRAALLAQNDFACFLTAKLEDRAQQLARITDTEQYSAIGKKTHELWSAHRDAVASVQLKAGEHRPWTAEDEAAAVIEAEVLVGEDRAARDALRLADRAAAEWGRYEAATRRLLTADQALALAVAERERARPDRDRLAWAEVAERHADVCRAERDARGAVTSAEQEVVDRAKRVAVARGTLAEAEQQAGAAAAKNRALLQALPAADVGAARDLDRRLGLARQAHAHARAALDAAKADIERRAHALGVDVDARRANAERLRAQRDVLAAGAAIVPLLDDGEAVAVVRRAAEAVAAAAARAAEAERAVAQRDAAEAACAGGRVTLALRAAERERAASARAALGAPVDLDAPRAAVEAARGLRDRRVALLGCGAALERAVGKHAPQQAALAALEQELSGQDEREAVARALAAEAEQHVKGAEKLLDRVRALASLDARRGELVKGEPCPLCGSPDHPYADPALVPSVSPLEEQVRLLRAEAREAAGEAARGEAEGRATRARCSELVALVAALASEVTTCGDALQAAEAACPPSEQGPVGAAEATLAAALAALDERAALARAQGAADGACQQAERAEAEAVGALKPLEIALATAAQRELGALAERGEAEARAAAARAALEAKFAAWPEVGASLGPGSAKLVEDRLAVLRRARDAEREESAAVTRLDLAIGAAQAALDVARGEESATVALEGERAAAVTELVVERAGYFGGRDTDAVVAEHEAAVRGSEAELRLALERRSGAAASLVAAEAEHGRAVEAAAGKRAALEAAGAAWRQALERLGWSAVEFDARTLSPDDVTSLRERLAAVDRSCVAAEAERKGAIEERDASAVPTGVDAESVAAAVDAASAGAEQTVQRLHEARARHGAGRATGAKFQELAGDLAVAQEALKPWQQLRDLIGDGEGKRFRNLAQARTMGVLVELANERLEHFAPRYRLSQLPEAPLDLAIADSDAGGEQRGTASLSGGETFLVSLALALGLGRLTARTLKLKTMFIDEGFGALDSDRVDEVLAALQTIAGSGIQIGLISHVPAVAERVSARVEVVKRGATSTIDVR